MRFLTLASCALAALPLAACGDDGGSELPPLFEPRPECTGQAIQQFTGMHTQVISALAIGSAANGFDLDGNGMPDNKLSAIATIARPAINDALADYSLLIPVEFFDLQAAAADACVKFALYLGIYAHDGDADNEDTAVADGDCNDHDGLIRPGAAERPNMMDDNCDGRADEVDETTPSQDDVDHDGDGVSMMDGDCDDTNMMVRGGTNPLPEICGDGLDNDCSGVADRGPGDPPTTCYPYDATPDTIAINPLSFEGGKPLIKFDSGAIEMVNGKPILKAGPSLFAVSLPISGDISLTLKITGTQIEAEVVDTGGVITLKNGRLGGVIDARTADTIRGLEVEQIMLRPEDSLLDVIFAGPVGPILALQVRPPGDMYAGCRWPDIDVDRDGPELFCDSNPEDAIKTVDLCVDGDGTVVRDTGTAPNIVHCTEAVDDRGRPRFVDGISVEMNFETAPATLEQ